jgi:hypothetical protein
MSSWSSTPSRRSRNSNDAIGSVSAEGARRPKRVMMLIIRVRAHCEHLSGLELAEAHWHYRPNLDGIISALADRREVLILGRA